MPTRISVASLALLGLACGAPQRPANVVVYLVDTLRADHVGVYGYSRDTTPRLDAFARDAVVYEDAYSTTSWTRPAVASLLSGRSSAAHAAVSRSSALAPGVPLLGEWLREDGYHTAAVVTNPNVLPVWGFDRGFDDFYDVDSASRSARADRVNEVVFAHLGEAPRRPFFLYVHTRDPHGPYEPPPPYDRMFAPGGDPPRPSDAYDGEIRFNDEHFGVLIDRLRELGLYDDTLVVFTSDHGEELGERGRIGHGSSLFQEQLRIPLIVKYPGSAGAGTRVSQVVSLLDIAPTVLAVAGCARPLDLEGRDLRARPSSEPRPLFFDLDLRSRGELHQIAGARLGSHKLIQRAAPEASLQLFDLSTDPRERTDVVAREAPLAVHLQALLGEYRAQFASGLHLVVVNDLTPGTRVAEGRIRATGRFSALHTLQIEEGDQARLEAGDRELVFRFALRNRATPIGQGPSPLIDWDRLAVDLDPADSELEIVAFTIDGEPGGMFLGPEKRQASRAPLVLRAADDELQITRVEALLPSGTERSLEEPPGLYVANIRRREVNEVELDAELERRLRALGYAE